MRHRDYSIVVVDMVKHHCLKSNPEIEQIRYQEYLEKEQKYWPELPEEDKVFKRANFLHQLRMGSYRGNDQTENLTNLMPSVLSEFRRSGAQIVHVYSRYNGPKETKPDFAVKPDSEDSIVSKIGDSFFEGTDPQEIHLPKKLAFCGVNLNVCVRASAIDAVKRGHQSYVLLDLTANDRMIITLQRSTLNYLRRKGVIVTSVQKFKTILENTRVQQRRIYKINQNASLI